MIISYVRLITAAALPAVTAVFLYYMYKKGKFHKISYPAKMVLCGIIFGILAILGTEYGIPMNGAQINCRDASVLTAGLVFGWPAGLIAGIIGGTERWFASLWGIGTYTRVACTLATYFAGILAALINRFMLDKKRPTIGMAVFIAVTVETFHMMVVFFTHMDDPSGAIKVIKSCTVLMIGANSISVVLAVLFVSIIAHDNYLFLFKKKSETPLFESIQGALTVVIIVALVSTCYFVYQLQNNMAYANARTLLKNDLNDAADELEDQVDSFMIDECESVYYDIQEYDDSLKRLAKDYNICEIFIVDKNGIVTDCNVKKYIGYDMSSSDQSKEFLCLLQGKAEYVQEYGAIGANSNIYRKMAGIKTNEGFLQISYDSTGLYDIVSEHIESLADNRHVGKNGYIAITDNNKNLVSASTGFTPSTFYQWLVSGDVEPGSINTVKLAGKSYYYCAIAKDNYNICAIYPVEEAVEHRTLMIYLTMFIIVLVFMAINIVVYMIIKNIIVNQIVSMADSLSRISNGKLDETVDVHNSIEFASLSDDINRTVKTLEHYIEEAAARIDEELELAAKIQLSVLPSPENATLKRKEFDIFAKMDPAKEVGGDFYDIYYTAENELNIMIADVSGKGIPAAMFMMRAKSILKDFTESGLQVHQAFTNANNSLCNGNDAEMFVTAWQGKVHLDTGLVEYANAGHNPPIVGHKDGTYVYLKQRKNLVLAAMEDIPYRKNEIQLEPGDILLLYTDGVVEATNSKEELYGEDRLLHVLSSHSFDSMKEMLTIVRQDVDEFVGDAPQFDDLTMVAIRYNGNETEIASTLLVEDKIDGMTDEINDMTESITEDITEHITYSTL